MAFYCGIHNAATAKFTGLKRWPLSGISARAGRITYVRYWQLADISEPLINVCFRPQSGHRFDDWTRTGQRLLNCLLAVERS